MDRYRRRSESMAGKSAAGAAPSGSSRIHWNGFCEFLKNRRPPISPSSCSGDDAVEFLRYVRRFDAVKIHQIGCRFYGDPNPLMRCDCMSLKSSGSVLDLVCLFRAVFEENIGGNPEENPFRSTSVKRFLMDEEKLDSLERLELAAQLFDIQPAPAPAPGKVFLRVCDHGLTGGSCQDAEEAFAIRILKELIVRQVSPYRNPLIKEEMANLGILRICRAAIVIFSINYACCAKCQDELVMIMDCWKANALALIPVYFNVTPSEVRDQKGRFGEMFLGLADTVQADKVQKWRTTMTEAASISGYEWAMGTEAILVEEIVRNVCLRRYSTDSKNLIGIDFQVERILSLFCRFQPSDVLIIGIWGAVGIGKTTIAREIFRRISDQYDSCYFLPDFHLMSQIKGLGHLRDDFLSTVFRGEKLGVSACDIKQSFMRDIFRSKTVLVVLDDVRNARDAEILLGGFDWFSPGHVIILTSRNRQVLVQCKVKELHVVQKLDKLESIRLFCHYAAEKELKIMNLNLKLVKYASGIPLILIVLGTSGRVKGINTWNKHLQRLRQHPPKEIQVAFRRSFDGLDENEKKIFLDLACFFRGENINHVRGILDGCGFFTDLGIFGLIDESLISLLSDKIEMDNIIQDMGRFVVHEEDKEQGKRSRLWDPVDIAYVFSKNSGTEAIEGIFLDTSKLKWMLNPRVFERMYRLRLLKVYCTTFDRSELSLPYGLDFLPEELRLLHWESYPEKSLPRNFNPKNLVELNMPFSNIEKLWKGTKNLKKLKIMRLSHSERLMKIPRLSKAWNLEHIDLEGCTSLVKVTSSIRYLDKLVSVNLKDCSSLRRLPATVCLESLEVLNISGCSKLEDMQDFSRNLKELYLAGTAIRELSPSIENLTKLTTLDLENCKRLERLPMEISNLKSLITLTLSGCSNLEGLPKLEALHLKGFHHPNLTRTAMKESAPLMSCRSAFQGGEFEKASLRILRFLSMSVYARSLKVPMVRFTRPSLGRLPLSILHSLASKVYFLASLFLCDVNLQNIPEEVCRLPLLATLDLGGNDFSRIPESIKELSKLRNLRLGCCRNLISLPKLPKSLEVLDAHGCESLRSIPWCLEKIHVHYVFTNCFKLSPLEFQEFYGKASFSLMDFSEQHQQDLLEAPVFGICLPASASPIPTTFLTAGSSIEMHLNPSWRKTLVGFTIPLVVAFWGDYDGAAGFAIRCICRWKTKGRLSWSVERIFDCWAPRETVPKVKKDHMFVFWDLASHLGADEGNDSDISADEVAFEFYLVNKQNELLPYGCRVKKCGVHATYAPTTTTSVTKKRPVSSFDPVELSYERDIIPPYKRARIREVVERVITEIRKRKKEQIVSRVRNLDKKLDKKREKTKILSFSSSEHVDEQCMLDYGSSSVWRENRKKWIGDQSQRIKTAKDPIISWSTTYEDLLSTHEPFSKPIPLPEMVDFLVDIWYDEGLYD